MSRTIATILSTAFICIMLLYEFKRRERGVSFSIWLPVAWLFLAASRSVSQWIHPGNSAISSEALQRGNPIDRITSLIMIGIGVFILIRRNFNLTIFIRKNIWTFLYFVYGAISILWSDYPFVSMKRLFLTSGNIIIALVILTEQNPREAFGSTMRCTAILLLPLSLLFIKYIPELGRAYFMGNQMATGVATQKNGLGQICLIVGIYLAWSLIINGRNNFGQTLRRAFLTYVTIIPMCLWLLVISGSATSNLSMLLALILIMLGRLPVITRRPNRVLVTGLMLVAIAGVAEAVFGISRLIIVNVLGRDLSLTGRTDLWQYLVKMVRNPALGVGYESFWLGERLEAVSHYSIPIIQAHNGYLETYLNLGIIGLSLLVLCLITGLVKAQSKLKMDFSFSYLKLIFIIIFAFYNMSEAMLHGVNSVWFLLLLSIIDMSGQKASVRAQAHAEIPSPLLFPQEGTRQTRGT